MRRTATGNAVELGTYFGSRCAVRRTTLIILLLMLACSQQRKQEQARDELTSWTANGQVLAHDYARGKVYKPFAKSSVEVAADSLKGLAKPLQDDEHAKDALQKVTNAYDKLSRAVENEDRSAAEEASTDFEAIKKKLDQEKQQ